MRGDGLFRVGNPGALATDQLLVVHNSAEMWQ